MSMTDAEMMTALIDRFDTSTAQVLDVKTDAFDLHLNKRSTSTTEVQPVIAKMPTTQPATTASSVKSDMQQIVKAPLVGVAYLAADPKQAPYVQVGDQVKAGDTLCVIEAMKMINEVPSPVSGIVKKITVTNGSMIEFDEPLMTIEMVADE